jgi:hypothetical protein
VHVPGCTIDSQSLKYLSWRYEIIPRFHMGTKLSYGTGAPVFSHMDEEQT